MYEKELEQLGLGEKEARVYLAALELGPETAQNIATKAGINRPTTYVQIESLKNKGLMSEFIKGKKTFYVAESPDRLVSLLNTFAKELDFKKAEISRILPALAEMFAGAGEKPKVRFFEGLEAVKALQEEFLKAKGGIIYSFSDYDKVLDFFTKHSKDYSARRIAKGIKGKLIYTRKDGPWAQANNPAQLREAKYLQSDKFTISADITIYDNKVSFVTYRSEPIGVIVENQDIADTLKAIFELFWAII